MAIQLSNTVNKVKPSPTLAVTQRAQDLRAQGKDIIGLGAGEPDFDTPEYIKEAAIAAIQGGKTKYTAVEGVVSLREAICEKLENFNKLSYKPSQVIVSTGGKQCIYNMLMATINPGDEVIIPTPYWVSYPDMVLLAGGEPVIVTTTPESRFKLTPEALEKAITPKTKLLFINSPSNPTGIAYTKDELSALGDVLLRYPDVYVATDDMYEHTLWEGQNFNNILMASPNLYERTMVLSGVSKAYSMTGWRIGYASGPNHVIKAMKKIQSQSTSNPCSIAQAAAEAAIRGPLDFVKEMVAEFKKRHDFVVESLNAMNGVTCAKGDGTFYAFPNFEGVLEQHGLMSDVELAEKLIEDAGVALVPGSAFGAPGHLRLSYATSMDNLEKAIERLNSMLSS